MTLYDLLYKLQKQGKTVLGYEFFVSGNIFLGDEDRFCVKPGRDISTRLDKAALPPRMIDLGDSPYYVWVETKAAYKKLTQDESISEAKKFPRLLVFVSLQMEPQEFLNRYFGCMWDAVPPMEWNFVEAGQYTPYLDKLGCVIDFLEGGIPRSAKHTDYYMVRSKYGNEFAWGGDLTKDKLPDGLTVIDAPDFILSPD